MEDGQIGRLRAVSERLEDALVRLVGGVAGDRELLQLAVGDPLRRVGPEECQRDSADSDEPAVMKSFTG